MTLKVIGGMAGGRRLKLPPATTRPTSAIMRRSLFDTLGAQVMGMRVLDLYAGAGTLGIEALSRGAASCEFVDRDRRCAEVIRSNLEAVGWPSADMEAQVHCAAVETWLDRNVDRLEAYDLVLLDPPYGEAGLARAAARLGAATGLAAGALVVAEQAAREEPLSAPGLVQVRRTQHGTSSFVVLRRAA